MTHRTDHRNSLRARGLRTVRGGLLGLATIVVTGLAGTAVADAHFGAPWPGFDAPAIERGFTMRHHGRITSGDKAIFETELVIGGDPEHFVQRRDVESPVRVDGTGSGRRVIELGRTNSSRDIRSNRRNRSRGEGSPSRGISVSKTGRKSEASRKNTSRP